MKRAGSLDGCPIYLVEELSLHGLYMMKNGSGWWSVVMLDHTRFMDDSEKLNAAEKELLEKEKLEKDKQDELLGRLEQVRDEAHSVACSLVGLIEDMGTMIEDGGAE